MNNDQKHNDTDAQNHIETSDLTGVAGGSPPGVPPPQPKTEASAPDPFDPETLRLTQDFGQSLGVRKAMITVPVRKPAREWWVRVHPDPAFHLNTAVLELKEDREIYIVDPLLWPDLATESTFSPRALFTAINTVGVVFLWPVRLPGPDGKIDDWNRSLLEITTLAQKQWVRVQSNMSLGAYEVLTSDNDKLPLWPHLSFRDLLQIAFKEKHITSLDHPAIKKLRGVL